MSQARVLAHVFGDCPSSGRFPADVLTMSDARSSDRQKKDRGVCARDWSLFFYLYSPIMELRAEKTYPGRMKSMANMVVRTNVFALNAHRNMKNVGAEQQRASNRLASGFRINSAADDAAGLAISETMRAQIRGLDQASRNAQDGQALINTAEGGMQEIQNMMQRIRELTVQAANDTNDVTNRRQISLEINQLMEEIDSMADRVEFNGMALLNGTLGANANVAVRNQLLDFISDLSEAALKVVSYIDPDTDATVTGTGISLDDLAAALGNQLGTTVETTDILNALNRAGIVMTQEQLDVIASGTLKIDSTLEESVWGSAEVTVADARTFIALLSSVADVFSGNVWFQTGANSDQGMLASVSDMRIFRDGDGNDENLAGLGAAMGGFVRHWQNEFITDGLTDGGQDVSFLINFVEDGLRFVSNARANLGAYSNRLDFTSRSLDISSENLSDAESRVRNTDMAREMMRFTMSNVLQQAAVSMLAQANQLPNNLLQLLR